MMILFLFHILLLAIYFVQTCREKADINNWYENQVHQINPPIRYVPSALISSAFSKQQKLCFYRVSRMYNLHLYVVISHKQINLLAYNIIFSLNCSLWPQMVTPLAVPDSEKRFYKKNYTFKALSNPLPVCARKCYKHVSVEAVQLLVWAFFPFVPVQARHFQ